MRDAPPIAVRSEFNAETQWGSVSDGLRRYEIVTPERKGPVLGISESIACVHGSRCSLMVRIGGGHLRAPRENLVARIEADAPKHLHPETTPDEDVQRVVSWLEKEQRDGFLEHSYTTATLLAVVSDQEVWTWHAGPHGASSGSPHRLRFRGTDLRYPALRALGAMKEPAVRFPGTDAADKATSIFCIGTPLGYERLRMILEPGELAIAFERGTLPFGPWPEGTTLGALWGLDAVWMHGLAGRAIVVGPVGASDLELPPDWRVSEVPLGRSLSVRLGAAFDGPE